MARALGDMPKLPTWDCSADTVRLRVQVNIGATGAPTVVGLGDITVTRGGTGSYTMTFPPMAAQAVSLGSVKGYVVLSAAKTVSKVIVTALNLTAGTASFTTALTSGTAADPANGDILQLEVLGNSSGVA